MLRPNKEALLSALGACSVMHYALVGLLKAFVLFTLLWEENKHTSLYLEFNRFWKLWWWTSSRSLFSFYSNANFSNVRYKTFCYLNQNSHPVNDMWCRGSHSMRCSWIILGGSEETEADVGWTQPQLITLCLSFFFTSISANWERTAQTPNPITNWAFCNYWVTILHLHLMHNLVCVGVSQCCHLKQRTDPK